MVDTESHRAPVDPTRGRGDSSTSPGGPTDHTADRVFRELARTILTRELTPGSSLPSERELGDRFGVSRIVVREAVHRLKDHQLVKVRQGASTVVLDWDEASDPRLVMLELELAPRGSIDTRDVTERQILGAVSMLAIAEHRIEPAEIDELDAIVDAHDRDGIGEPGLNDFEREYWTVVARATRNRIYVREAGFWFKMTKSDPGKRHLSIGSPRDRLYVYRQIGQRLRERTGAAAFFLTLSSPVISAMSAPETMDLDRARDAARRAVTDGSDTRRDDESEGTKTP